MSTTFIPKITASGLAAIWNAENSGVALTLTHVSLGSACYRVSGSETALKSEQIRLKISGTAKPAVDIIQMRAVFQPQVDFQVREVGIWAGDKFFVLWSCGTGDVRPPGYASAGVKACASRVNTLEVQSLQALKKAPNTCVHGAWGSSRQW